MAGFNEADTRAKLIDPAIHGRGWTEDLIRREETAGAVEIINGKPRRRSRGKIDYVLRVKVNVDTQPVALDGDREVVEEFVAAEEPQEGAAALPSSIDSPEE